MSVFADIKGFLVNLGKGAVAAFGDPSAQIQALPHPSGKGVLVALREGYTVSTHAGPERVLRQHVFDDLAGFADWLQRHADPAATEILVDQHGVVRALLDSRAVPAGDVVECRLQPHPRLARWLVVLGKMLAQKQIHRLIVGALEDFPRAQAGDGTDLGSAGSILAGQFQRIEVVKGGSLAVHLDELGNTRFAGASDSKEIQAKLPPRFTISVPWFIGADPEAAYDLEVHLSATADERSVTFGLDVPSLDVVRHKAVLEAVDHLRALLGDGWLVGLGCPKLASVPHVAKAP